MDKTSLTITHKLQAYLDTFNFCDAFAEIQLPILLVDETTPPSLLAQQQFMAECLPICRLAVYPNVGHGINVRSTHTGASNRYGSFWRFLIS
jgi:hypothetical protein